jgi:hypothetical protein
VEGFPPFWAARPEPKASPAPCYVQGCADGIDCMNMPVLSSFT